MAPSSEGAITGLGCATTQQLDKVLADAHTVSGGRLMELDGVLDIIGLAQDGPELHSYLGRQGHEVVSEVLDLLITEGRLERLAGLHFLNHGCMVIDAPICGQFDLAIIEDVGDGYLLLVLLNEVAEGNSSLETDEGACKIENHIKILLVGQQLAAGASRIQAMPGATRRINLVRLEIAQVLKVGVILVNEVPDNGVDVGFCPAQPVLDSGLHIKHGPAVKLCRVHFAHLILRAMLATVDGCKDASLRVEVPAVNLATIGQLEKSLTDLWGRAVHFVQEQDNGLGASLHQPIGSVPGRSLAPVDFNVTVIGQTQQVALGHLRRTALDDGQLQGLVCNHVDHLRLADAMASANQDGQTRVEDERSGGKECCEIDGHLEPPRWVSIFNLLR